MIIKISHTGETKPQARKAIEYILRPKNGQGRADRILAVQSNSNLPYIVAVEPETFAHFLSNQIEETFLHENKKPQKFLYDHIIFSYAKDDKLTPDQAVERAKEALLDYWNQSRKKKRKKPLTELPMDYMLAAQNDTKNGILHVHGIVGRRDSTGFYNNHSQNYKTLRSIAMGIEDRYGYKATQKVAKSKAFPANHKEWQDVSKGNKNTKFHVRKCVERTIKKSANVKEFMELMKMQRIYAVPNISSTGRMSGFKFRHEGEYFTASQLHRSFGWANISKQLDFDPSRDIEILKRMAEKMAEVAEKVNDNGNALSCIESKSKGKKKFDNRYALHRIMRADEGGVYRYSRFDRVAFRDHGSRISFETTTDTAVKAALQLCVEKGWTTVVPSGSAEFKAKSWLHAQAMGLTLKGYEPTAKDIQSLREQYGIEYQAITYPSTGKVEKPSKSHQPTIGERAKAKHKDAAPVESPSKRLSDKQQRLVESMRRMAAKAEKNRPRGLFDEYFDRLQVVLDKKHKQTGVEVKPTPVQSGRYITKAMIADGHSPDLIYSELCKNGGFDAETAEKLVRATLDDNEKVKRQYEAHRRKYRPKPRKPTRFT
ncbi:LPD7 domain-containing protein [Marinobacter sp. SS8-8]|uniref:LPD7 domain-containing protein n=1 Tax=Marinobacter sp. SS8-8 TaxID=3050452 RepID=UPI0026E09C27|nr:LPD7 domain-containing protein [Marinobacter sp. SS8-8]